MKNPTRGLLIATTLLAFAIEAAPLFRQPFPINAGSGDSGQATELLAADFTGDGGADLLTVHGDGRTVVVPSNGSGPFAAPIYSTTRTTRRFADADLNGDGKRDFIGTNGFDVFTRLGNGDGTFAAATVYGSVAQPFAIATGDVNGDGKADVIVASAQRSIPELGVHFGNGAGALGAVSKLSLVNAHSELAVADLNNDGKADVVANGAYVYLGSASGLLAAGDVQDSSGSTAVAIGHFNGDSARDLVVGLPGKVIAYAGNGSGSFTKLAEYAVSQSALQVAVADMNADQFNDIVVRGASTIAVLRGLGTGSFQAPLFSSGSNDGRFAIADFDADGKLDVVTTPKDATRPRFSKGNGDGTLRNDRGYAMRSVEHAPLFGGGSVADMNGDNKPDVVALYTPYAAAAQISVARNNGSGGLLAPVLTTLPETAAVSNYGIGRVNADAYTDVVVVVVTTEGTRALAFLGRSDGGFTTGATSTVLNQGLVQLADFTGDGKTDLLIEQSIYPGNGSGGFGAAQAISMRFEAYGDLDGNGALDGVGYSHEGLIIALKKNGVYVNTVIPYPTREQNIPELVADLNGDTYLDILGIAAGGGEVYVYHGNGDGTFDLPRHMGVPLGSQPAFYGSATMPFGDFDGDGDRDVVVGTSILLGTGNGYFHDWLPTGAAGYAGAGDFDGNGRTDLVVFAEGTAIVMLAGLAPASLRTPAITFSAQDAVIEYPRPAWFNTRLAGEYGPVTGNVVLWAGDVPVKIQQLDVAPPADASASLARIARAMHVGSHTITAKYTGDVTYLPVTATASQTIDKGNIGIYAQSPGATIYGNEFRLSFGFSDYYTPYLPGPSLSELTLRTGDAPLNNVRWEADGVFVKGLNAGNWLLTVEFAGDDNYESSSANVTHQVSKRSGASTNTVLPAGSARLAGPVTFDIAIPAGVYGAATGSVTLTIDNRAPVTIALTNGRGQYTTNLAAGTYKATVNYPGDANHIASTSQFDVQVYVAWGAPTFITASYEYPNVHVRWTPVAGAASYTLYKKTTYASAWQEIGVWTSSHTEFMSSMKTWMFAVAPRNEAGGLGPMSAPDIVTAIPFGTLVPKTTVIRREHVSELHVAANAMREFAGLAAYPFPDYYDLVTIRAVHITQLRTAIAQARSAIGLPAIAFTDPTLTPGTSVMRMVHIEEMRNGVR